MANIKQSKKHNSSSDFWEELFWFIMIIVGIVLIVIGLSKLVKWKEKSLDQSTNIDPNSLTEDVEAKNTGRLQAYLQNTVKDERKFNRQFKWAYLLARVLIIAVFVILNIALYKWFGLRKLGDFVDYNQVILTGFVLAYFLVNGKFTNPQKEIERLRDWLKNKLLNNGEPDNKALSLNTVPMEMIEN